MYEFKLCQEKSKEERRASFTFSSLLWKNTFYDITCTGELFTIRPGTSLTKVNRYLNRFDYYINFHNLYIDVFVVNKFCL